MQRMVPVTFVTHRHSGINHGDWEDPSVLGKRRRVQARPPVTGIVDDLMEGIYFRTESKGLVTSRAKFVRPEFVHRARPSQDWQHRSVVPNELVAGVDIWR